MKSIHWRQMLNLKKKPKFPKLKVNKQSNFDFTDFHDVFKKNYYYFLFIVSKVAERRMKEENERQEKIKKEREEFKQALKSRKNITSSTVVSSEEILDENNEEILEENNEKKMDSGDETDPEVDPNIVTRRPLSEEKIEEENLNILKNVKPAEFSKNQQDESP